MKERPRNLFWTWVVLGLCLRPLALLTPVLLGHPLGPGWRLTDKPLSNALDIGSTLSIAASIVAAVAVLAWAIRTRRFAWAILLWAWLAVCAYFASRTGIWIS